MIKQKIHMHNKSLEVFYPQEQQKEQHYRWRQQKIQYINGVTSEEVNEELAKYPFVVEYLKNNTEENQWTFIETMMRETSQGDGPGFVYGFMDEKQNKIGETPYWIKIGMTKKEIPQDRIFQWEKDDKKKFTEIFTIRTKRHKKLQKLAHALFHYARKQRIINEATRIEWFNFKELTITAAAISIVDHIMETLHLKHESSNKILVNKKIVKIDNALYQLHKGSQFFSDSCSKNLSTGLRDFQAQMALDLKNEERQKLKLVENETQLRQQLEKLHTGEEIIKLLDNLSIWEKKIDDCIKLNKDLKDKIISSVASNEQSSKISQISVKTRIPQESPKSQKTVKKVNKTISNIPSTKQIPQLDFKHATDLELKSLNKYAKQSTFLKEKNQEKVERIMIREMSQIQKYSSKNSIDYSLINKVNPQFVIDVALFEPQFSLVVLSPSIKIMKDCNIVLKEGKTVSLFCKTILGFQKLRIEGNMQNFSIFQVHGAKNCMAIDEYHLQNPQKIDQVFVQKMMKGFKQFL